MSAPGIDDPSKPVPWREKWSFGVLYKLFLYFSFCFIALNALPNSIWDPELRRITVLIGTLCIWRYSWWFTHAVRARI